MGSAVSFELGGREGTVCHGPIHLAWLHANTKNPSAPDFRRRGPEAPSARQQLRLRLLSATPVCRRSWAASTIDDPGTLGECRDCVGHSVHSLWVSWLAS